MTRRILKWTIPVDDCDHPIGAGPVVHVDVQGNDTGLVQVWTDETDADNIRDATSARVYGTGQPLPEHDEVVGTALALGGALVWHVLRACPEPREGDWMPAHQHDCSLHSCWRSTCCNPRRPDCAPETT